MKSKSERVSDSISNLKTGIVYLYKHMTKDFENNKVGKNTYDSLSKSLKKLHSVLKGLQEEITYKNDKLDEIRKIIGHDINYSLSSDMFLKDMERMVMRGAIISLDRKFADVMPNDYKTFIVMATDLLERDYDNE